MMDLKDTALKQNQYCRGNLLVDFGVLENDHKHKLSQYRGAAL